MNIFKRIFSIKKNEDLLVINIFFFKIKFKKDISNKTLELKINTLEQEIKSKLSTILANEVRFFDMYIPPKKKMELNFLSIHLVDKCNNNCESCSHFCTLADNFKLDIKDFERQLTILSQKFHIKEIDLMGGEPLLHPEINTFFDITRKILPDTFICLHTNAILLPKMDETFWDSCRRNSIAFKITKYPTVEDFSSLLDLCLEKGVWIAGIINGKTFLHWMDKTGQGNIEENFFACKSKFGYCYILRDYRLYTCPTACYMNLYNSAFNTHIPEEKGIDIITASDEEIIKYLNTPLSTCKYCRNVHNLTPRPWRRSSRAEWEWDDAIYREQG